MSKKDIEEADEGLKNVLKCDFGWLDVQEGLWRCYQTRMSQNPMSRKLSKYIPWYAALWTEKMPSPEKNFGELQKVVWAPSLYTNFPSQNLKISTEDLKRKQQKCINEIGKLKPMWSKYLKEELKGQISWKWSDFYCLTLNKVRLKSLTSHPIYLKGLGIGDDICGMLLRMIEILKENP